MIIYDHLRVIDGDTIEIRLWPSGFLERCRIEGLDTDEMDTHRGKEQKRIADRLMVDYISCWVFNSVSRTKRGRVQKRDAYGRLLVRVYVWRWWRYVNYAEYMKKTGNVKRGSKWNI